ncbi:protein SLX4IP isoform X4 [Rhinatrema bivittatum]|nr:protein SLX4IP isoform X4 [Rhinatrema bivittatum]XP_029449399.1 protein SLX4IP isoform X4 [Rhinatrema bivittatum]XP_029449400.1 protein SLX4IP isoform X4 [Rhinatrema bivittatum]
MLLKDTIVSRVKQYLESRKQHGQSKHKEVTQCSPLILKGNKLSHCCLLHEKMGKPSLHCEGAVSSIKKISTTTMKKTLGAEDYETEYRKCEHLTSSNSQSETKCRHAGQPINDYKNTAESNLEPPGSEMENYVNQRQPDDASSQQNPHFVERLEAELLDRNSSWSCESAPPDPKQSQGSTIMQQKQNRHYSEEKQDFCKKASFGKNIFIPWEMVMKERNASSLMPATEKSLLNPMSSNVLVEASSNEELLTLNSIPLRPVLMKNTMEHTNQNKPATDTQELPLIPTSSHLKINHSPLEELFQESKKGIENQPRRLKLQRFKKS